MNADKTQYVHPGLLRRLAAALYDLLLVAGLLVLASAAVTLPVGLIFGPEASAQLSKNPLFAIWLATMPLLFFVGFWTWGGQTLGMRAWRMKLLGSDGNKASLNQSVIRFFSAFVSWIPLGLGFWWSLLDSENRTWHDRISNTQLVMLEKK